MTDEELTARLDALDPILEGVYDTQMGVQRDPYGATKAIEKALYLLRDQADRIEALVRERDAAWNKVAEADTRITSSALDALAAYDQAQDAHEAQLGAEAKLAKAVERLTAMRDDRIGYRHAAHFRRGAAVTLAGLEGPT